MSVEAPHVQPKSQIIKRLKVEKDEDMMHFKIPDTTAFISSVTPEAGESNECCDDEEPMDQDDFEQSGSPITTTSTVIPKTSRDSIAEDNNNETANHDHTLSDEGINKEAATEDEVVDSSIKETTDKPQESTVSSGNNEIDKEIVEQPKNKDVKEDKPDEQSMMSNYDSEKSRGCGDDDEETKEEGQPEPETLGSSSEGNGNDVPPLPPSLRLLQTQSSSSPSSTDDSNNADSKNANIGDSLAKIQENDTRDQSMIIHGTACNPPPSHSNSISNQLNSDSCLSPEEIDKSLSSSSEGVDLSESKRQQEAEERFGFQEHSYRHNSGAINLRQNYRSPSQNNNNNNNSGGNLNSIGNHIIRPSKIVLGGSTSPESVPTINLSALQQRGVIHYSHHHMGPNQDKRKTKTSSYRLHMHSSCIISSCLQSISIPP
jgi:hypothetical protein